MAALSAKGGARATINSQDRIVKLMDMFCAQDPECVAPHEWKKQSESLVCSAPFFERFAYFLLHTYVKPEGTKDAGKPLEGDTPKVYLNLAINQAANKYKLTGSDVSKRFFLCLDLTSKSPEAIWLRGLRTNLTRNIFDRAKQNGQEMDKSEGQPRPAPCDFSSPASVSTRTKLTCLLLLAVPLYLAAHIMPMLTALARKGDSQATSRRYAAPLALALTRTRAHLTYRCWLSSNSTPLPQPCI